MKKKGLIVVFIFIISLSGISEAYSQVIVKVKPVRVKVEVVKKTRRPGKNYVWVEGQWRWNKKQQRYVWIDGRWIKEKNNRVWAEGYWRKVPGGWIWVSGHWT